MTSKIIVAVFNNEDVAYDTAYALKDLEKKNIGFKVKAGVLFRKDEKGNIRILKEKDKPLWNTLGSTIIGTLIGLLAGPAGAVAGAVIGGSLGLVGDAMTADFDDVFVSDIMHELTPLSAGIILEASEDSKKDLDDIIQSYNGKVYRQDI